MDELKYKKVELIVRFDIPVEGEVYDEFWKYNPELKTIEKIVTSLLEDSDFGIATKDAANVTVILA